MNEISNTEEVLKKVVDLPRGTSLKADKGYQSTENANLPEKRGLKNAILKKSTTSMIFPMSEKKNYLESIALCNGLKPSLCL